MKQYLLNSFTFSKEDVQGNEVCGGLQLAQSTIIDGHSGYEYDYQHIPYSHAIRRDYNVHAWK